MKLFRHLKTVIIYSNSLHRNELRRKQFQEERDAIRFIKNSRGALASETFNSFAGVNNLIADIKRMKGQTYLTKNVNKNNPRKKVHCKLNGQKRNWGRSST